MAKITNKVPVQMFGDVELQKRIIDVLMAAGIVNTVRDAKPYTTKKGEEGYYQSLTFTTTNQ